MGQRQTVPTQIRRRRTRRLISVFTVCLQSILLKMKHTTQQPLKRKWTGPIDESRNSIRLNRVNPFVDWKHLSGYFCEQRRTRLNVTKCGISWGSALFTERKLILRKIRNNHLWLLNIYNEPSWLNCIKIYGRVHWSIRGSIMHERTNFKCQSSSFLREISVKLKKNHNLT